MLVMILLLSLVNTCWAELMFLLENPSLINTTVLGGLERVPKVKPVCNLCKPCSDVSFKFTLDLYLPNINM